MTGRQPSPELCQLLLEAVLEKLKREKRDGLPGHRRPSLEETSSYLLELASLASSGVVPSPPESSGCAPTAESGDSDDGNRHGARSRSQAARFLGISMATLDRLRAAGVIPATSARRRVLYAPADLEAYIQRKDQA